MCNRPSERNEGDDWFWSGIGTMHPESAPVEVLHVWYASASPDGPDGIFGSEEAAAAFLDAVEPYAPGDATIVERVDYERLRRRIPPMFRDAFGGDAA